MKTNIVQNWSDVAFASLQAFGEKTLSVLPNIIGAIIFLIIGWLVARFVSFIVIKGLKLIKFDKVKNKLISEETLKNTDIEIIPSKIIGKFVYWAVLLMFFILAADILGWQSVSKELGSIVRYLPQLFSGLLILAIGVFIANFIRQAILAFTNTFGINAGKILSNAAYYIILIFLVITALNQIGVDTSILNANITIILGTVLFAFALSFALASKDLLQNILSGLYSKNNFKPGQTIKIGDVKGKILKIDNISVLLETDEGKVVMPIRELTQKEVHIIS
jgi:small-conductance mechanosensitive channel